MYAACEREVVDLHAWFERWFRGVEASDGKSFERVASALSPEFVMITPTGRRTERAQVLESLKSAHASKPADFEIRIANFEVRWALHDAGLVVYEEHQTSAGTETKRISSALLRMDPSTPHGVVWLHLQETWWS